jgi:GntR family transcriptional regulator
VQPAVSGVRLPVGRQCPYIEGVAGPGRGHTRPVARSGAVPLWQQVLTDLRRRLADGQFADAFPGELALVQEYGVSRHTVREALRHLRAEGTVTAARGRKPRLAPAEVEQPLGALASLFASVEARGLEQRSVVRRLDLRADGVVATRLGLEESAPLVYLERLRLAGDEPLALDRAWLPAHIAAPLLAADFTRTALYDELATHCDIRLTGGHEQVRAVLATPGERRLLRLPVAAALLLVERTGCLDGQPLEFRHTLVRGDRFAVTAQLDGRGSTLAVAPRTAAVHA